MGPTTNASGPFTEGQRPIQCFKCKGWGHLRRICPSKGNLNFPRGGGNPSQTEAPPLSQGQTPSSNNNQEQNQ